MVFQGRPAIEVDARKCLLKREPYRLDSAGVSGVQSGTLPVPSSGNNQSDSAKDKVCNNNNNVEVSPKRSPKRKESISKGKEPKKKESDEKEEEVHENGFDGDGSGDNVMEVWRRKSKYNLYEKGILHNPKSRVQKYLTSINTFPLSLDSR